MKIEDIQQTHAKLLEKMDELHEIQTQTHAQYKEYLEKNKTNKVFGLDSFNYQTRLFDLEMKQVKEHYAFVNNRIYCDYYKLYGMVKTFYKENFKLEPKKRSYMPYKDLEPFKPFEFLDSMNLNQDILDMIQKSFEIIRKKEQEVSTGSHTLQRLNIENYIFNHRYNNDSLKTKVELYEKYLHSYHIYHMSFITNLLAKVSMLFQQNTQPLSISPVEPTTNEPTTNEPTTNERIPKAVVVNVLTIDTDTVSPVIPVEPAPVMNEILSNSVIVNISPVEPSPVEPAPVMIEPVAPSPVVSKEEPTEESKEEPPEESKEEPKEEPVAPSPVESNEDSKEEPTEESKEEPKEEPVAPSQVDSNENSKEEPVAPVESNEDSKEEAVTPSQVESKEDSKEEAVESVEMKESVPTTVSVEVQAVPQEVHEKKSKKSKKSKK
jgi:hypothetical protein